MTRVPAIFSALAFAVALALATGTVARADDSIGTYFNEPVVPVPADADLAPYREPGNGSISGRFNLVMNGSGGRLEYVGYDVDLIPALPWAYAAASAEAEFADHLRGSLLAEPLWIKPFVRRAQTDAHGNFRFDHVAPGSYIVMSLIQSVITTDRSFSYPTYDYGYDTTYITEHYVHNERKCNVTASLQAIVDVKGDEAVVTPIQIAGWAYDGQCSR